jgi:hypothetical protein
MNAAIQLPPLQSLPCTMADTTPSPPSASAEKAKLTPFDLTIDGYAEIPTTSNSPSGDTPLPSTIIGSTADVVPPTHTHRTLVLCFDGTGDQFSEDVSTIY